MIKTKDELMDDIINGFQRDLLLTDLKLIILNRKNLMSNGSINQKINEQISFEKGMKRELESFIKLAGENK